MLPTRPGLSLCVHSCVPAPARPNKLSPAAEVRSPHEGGPDGDSDDGDMMLVSPAPRAAAPQSALPDVRSLAEALEPPPVVVGLQVRRWRWAVRLLLAVVWLGLAKVIGWCRPSAAAHPCPMPCCLQNAVGDRVTLQLAGGGALRVALRCAPTSPLAVSALEALHAVLPGDTYWAVYARWLATEGGAGLPTALLAGCGTRMPSCCSRASSLPPC